MTSLDFASMLQQARRAQQDSRISNHTPSTEIVSDKIVTERSETSTASSSTEQAAVPEISYAKSRLMLSKNRIGDLSTVRNVFYVPEYISFEQERDLYLRVKQPLYPGVLQQQIPEEHKANWVHLPRRRLLNCGGVPHSEGMYAEPLPPIAATVVDMCEASHLFFNVDKSAPRTNIRPDQLLINEYNIGEGIAPHKDGPLYLSRAAILSIGQDAVIDFYQAADLETDGTICEISGESRRTGQPGNVPLKIVASVLLERRSMLIFDAAMYTDVWHSITPGRCFNASDELFLNAPNSCSGSFQREDDFETRVSFTVRKAASVKEALNTEEVRVERERRKKHWLAGIGDTK